MTVYNYISMSSIKYPFSKKMYLYAIEITTPFTKNNGTQSFEGVSILFIQADVTVINLWSYSVSVKCLD